VSLAIQLERDWPTGLFMLLNGDLLTEKTPGHEFSGGYPLVRRLVEARQLYQSFGEASTASTGFVRLGSPLDTRV
jgi:hypothetical protein